MSQANNQIGEAVIKVRADVSGVLADIDAIKPAVDAKVQELGGAGRTFAPGKGGAYALETPSQTVIPKADQFYELERANTAAAKATREHEQAQKTLGQTMRDQVAGQRDFISGLRQQVGVITSVVSAATAMVGIVGLASVAGYKLGESLFRTGDNANRLADNIDRVNKQIAEFNKLREESLGRRFGEDLDKTGLAFVAKARADEQAKLDAAEKELQTLDESGVKAAARGIETALFSVGLPAPYGISGSVAEREDIVFKINDAKANRDALAKQFEGIRERETAIEVAKEGNQLLRENIQATRDLANRMKR